MTVLAWAGGEKNEQLKGIRNPRNRNYRSTRHGPDRLKPSLTQYWVAVWIWFDHLCERRSNSFIGQIRSTSSITSAISPRRWQYLQLSLQMENKLIIMPQKMFVGVDGSKGIGFDPDNYSHFVLVAVSCSNMDEAKKAAHSIDSHGPKRQLYTKWTAVIKRLIDFDLRYYIMIFDKRTTSEYFRTNSDNIPSSQWNNSPKHKAVFEQYAKHGWLIPEVWIRFNGKFSSEFKFDGDLNGDVWKSCIEQTKKHAENHVGPCEVGVAGEEYALIRIAHIIATFVHNQLIDGALIQGEPTTVWCLKPRLLITRFIAEPDVGMYTEPNPMFDPW